MEKIGKVGAKIIYTGKDRKALKLRVTSSLRPHIYSTDGASERFVYILFTITSHDAAYLTLRMTFDNGRVTPLFSLPKG